MKKIFKNVGGNQFRLLTESIDNNTTLIRSGLKKVFSAGNKELSYKRIGGVGLGYIKSVSEATKTAIQEAREIASEYGYMDNPDQNKFVKEINTNPEGDMASPNGDMSNPEESREVQIAKKILQYAQLLKKYLHGEEGNGTFASANAIEKYAEELIQMHGKEEKKSLSGWDTLQLGSH